MGGRDHGIKAVNWWGTGTPLVGPTGTSTTWVGIAVQFSVAGRIAGLRRYDNTVADGNLPAWIFDFDANTNKVTTCFKPRASTVGNAWHQAWFRPWLRIVVGHRYYIGFLYFQGNFFRNNGTLSTAPVTRNNIQYWASWQSTAIYPFATTPTTNTNANAVDVLFYPD